MDAVRLPGSGWQAGGVGLNSIGKERDKCKGEGEARGRGGWRLEKKEGWKVLAPAVAGPRGNPYFVLCRPK